MIVLLQREKQTFINLQKNKKKMKKVITLVAVFMMSVSSFAADRTPTSNEVKKEIRAKIVKLLGNADFAFKKEVKTTVDLLINKKGEIVVLDIECANPSVCAYVKRKLNYKKVYKELNNSVKVYKMPLRIVKQ